MYWTLHTRLEILTLDHWPAGITLENPKLAPVRQCPYHKPSGRHSQHAGVSAQQGRGVVAGLGSKNENVALHLNYITMK